MPTTVNCYLCNRINQGRTLTPSGKKAKRSVRWDEVTGEQLLPLGICPKCDALPEDERRALSEMALKNVFVKILTTDFGESLKDAREFVANHARVHTIRSES